MLEQVGEAGAIPGLVSEPDVVIHPHHSRWRRGITGEDHLEPVRELVVLDRDVELGGGLLAAGAIGYERQQAGSGGDQECASRHGETGRWVNGRARALRFTDEAGPGQVSATGGLTLSRSRLCGCRL